MILNKTLRSCHYSPLDRVSILHHTRAVPLLLNLAWRPPENSDWQLSHPQALLVLTQPVSIFLTHVGQVGQCHYLFLEVGTWGTELKRLLKVTHKAWSRNRGHVFPSPRLDQILPFWGKVSILAQPAPRVAAGFSGIKRHGSVLGKLSKQVSPVFLVEHSAGVTRTCCLGSLEVTIQSQYTQRRSTSTSAAQANPLLSLSQSTCNRTVWMNMASSISATTEWQCHHLPNSVAQLLLLFCIAAVFKWWPICPWGLLAVWSWQIFHIKHAYKLNN